jgi:hypothetical protein
VSKGPLAGPAQPIRAVADIEGLVQSALYGGETAPSTPFPINDLTDFGVLFRYTEPEGLTSIEREQIGEAVRTLRENVHARLIDPRCLDACVLLFTGAATATVYNRAQPAQR